MGVRVRFYPRRLIFTAVFLLTLWVGLRLATDFVDRGAVGVIGVAGLVAYLAIEIFLSFNPAMWRRERSRKST